MKRVLICGVDRALIDVRAQVLQAASFDASTLQGLSALLRLGLENAPDIIILCTSMSLIDRVAAKKLIEDRFPKVAVLTLLKIGEPISSKGHYMLSLDGPSKLVNMTRALTSD